MLYASQDKCDAPKEEVRIMKDFMRRSRDGMIKDKEATKKLKSNFSTTIDELNKWIAKK